MNVFMMIGEAVASLGKNKVRSMLSMLGIIIGVASVIAMVAVGEGAKQRVRAEIEALGDDWLLIGYWGIQRSGARSMVGITPRMAEDEAEAIVRECSTIRAASPSNRMSLQVASSFNNYQTSVQGIYPSYFDIRRWKIQAGSLFTEDDLNSRVCCIGQTAARELFGDVSPLEQQIRVRQITFRIIGVLAPKGTTGDGRDNDDIILFPWHVFQRQIAGNEISRTLLAAARPGIPLEIAKQQVRSMLRQRHQLAEEDPDDFRIVDFSLSAEADAKATETFNWLLMTIASISLVVGGVGIMNIMLVSVTERTREIGLRMAIGANEGHILGQFLIEAVVMCLVGGILGFAVGVGVAQIVRDQAGWEVVISYWMAGVAVAFASAIGLFFGFYPAWRASRLDPIEALRFE